MPVVKNETVALPLVLVFRSWSKCPSVSSAEWDSTPFFPPAGPLPLLLFVFSFSLPEALPAAKLELDDDWWLRFRLFEELDEDEACLLK